MKDGEINIGDRIPSICFQYPFYTLDHQPISFQEILSFPTNYSPSNITNNNNNNNDNLFPTNQITVLFASSITWPPLRNLLEDINKIVDIYSSTNYNVSFILFYILEAHALDEWPIYALPLELETCQHKSIEDRIVRANLLPKILPVHPKIKIYSDNEEDLFINTFCSWPFRYWILKNDIVVNKMMPEGHQITLKALEDELKNIFNET